MGIFDSLFSPNTNAALNKATGQANANLGAVGQSNDFTLRDQTQRANNVLTQNQSNADNNLVGGQNNALSALLDYGGQAQNELSTGVNSAVNTAQSSNGQYQPYVASGQGANGLYADSLGVNGAAGNAAATTAFQASPGYQWSVDQATDAAARKAASLGMAASGNTLDAITRLGSNLADQQYSNWQSGLSGLSSQGLTAANAVSGNNNAAAGYQYGGATTGANLSQQLGGAQAAIDQQTGQGLAGIDQSVGTQLAGLDTNLGNSLVNNASGIAKSQSGNMLADAQQQDLTDSANNGVLSSLLGSALGYAVGGGSSGGSGSGIFSKLLSYAPGGSNNFSNTTWGL